MRKTSVHVLKFGLMLMVLSGCGWSMAADNGKFQIENDNTRIVFDADTSSVTAYSKAGRVEYIKNIRFPDKCISVRVEDVSDAVFGKGQTIVLTTQLGNVNKVTLYQAFPFAFLQSTLKNSDSQTISFQNYAPFGFSLDLGKNADELKAHGTAGLTGVDKKSNSGSYAFLSIVDPQTRSGVVSAWLTNERGSGIVFSDVEAGGISLSPRIDYGSLQLKAGQSEALETFIIGWFEDARLGLEAYADAVAKRYAIQLKPQPIVYCTWYHAGASNETDLQKNAEFAEKNLKPFGFSVVQIDDKWQAGEKNNGPKKNFTTYDPNGPYKSGMKATADNIKKLGLVPGIWFMPFAGTYDDPWFADKQDLFATKDGKPFDTKWGGTCLDLTNPKTQRYVYDIAHRIAYDWGYQYFKMDGLYTGTATQLTYVNDAYKDDSIGESKLYDPSMTHIQAYRTGLKTVRKAAGDDVFFLGCCIPQNMRSFAPAMGLVDAMRIGPDNKRTWSAMLRGPNYGSKVYFLNKRVWYNDPDPIYVRQTDVPLQQAQTLCSWVTIAGQLNASSVQYDSLVPDRLDILKRTMPSHHLKPRPADIFEQKIPRVWLLTDEGGSVRRDVLALFNWDDKKSASIDYSLEKAGLRGDCEYVGFDFWANTFVEPFKDHIRTVLLESGCRILSLRPVSDVPQLVGTSRHITQGIIDVKEEEWDSASDSLQGVSEVVARDPYELRIVAMKKTGNWQFKSAWVSPADHQAGVAVKLVSQEGPYLRILIESKESRQVKWSVDFN